MGMRNFLKLFFILLSVQNFIISLQGTHEKSSLETNCSTIIEQGILKSLVSFFIEHGAEDTISDVLLTSYQELCENNANLAETLKNVLPDLITSLQLLQDKAPRENISHAIVGPPPCNLSEINQLLRKLHDAIVECCNNNSAEFNSTFTTLNEFKNTLTQCCENIANEFNDTFSVLYELDTTLSQCCATIFTEFNGTFSALNYAFQSTYTALDGTFEVILPLVNQLDSSVFTVNQIFNLCCTDLQNQIATCCQTIINALTQTNNNFISSFETIQNIIPVENNTFCVLNDVFPLNSC